MVTKNGITPYPGVRGDPIFCDHISPSPLYIPPKAPGFRAEWAPLGPFLLGGGMGAHEDRGSALRGLGKST